MRKRFLFGMVLVLTALFGGMVSAQAVDPTDVTLVGDAYYDSDNGWYVLTEEKTWQSGALWFSQVRCNDTFSISLDFYTGHAGHVDSFGGADGICVAFYAKGDQTGSSGEGLGFNGCGGYGVEVDTYCNSNRKDPQNNHIAIIQESVGNHLQTADATAFTEDGQWHHLKVENRRGVCTVYVDGTQILQQTGVEPNGQYEIGITGGTGSGYNFHAVKNIQLTEAVWSGSSEWADDELERAQQKNLIPEVLYDKDLSQTITRGEFAAVAVQLYEEWTDSTVKAKTSAFTDIARSECKTAIEKAYAIGVTNGTSATTFEPNTKITREQLATMLCRVYKNIAWENWTLETDGQFTLDTSGVKPFADDSLIYDYAKPSVYFMVKHSVINGVGDNKFAPKYTTSQEEAIGYAMATREQALVMSLRSLENLS